MFRMRFAWSDIRSLVTSGKLKMRGAVYADSDLRNYKLGKKMGELDIAPSKIEVLVNRRLESFMDPAAVAATQK